MITGVPALGDSLENLEYEPVLTVKLDVAGLTDVTLAVEAFTFSEQSTNGLPDGTRTDGGYTTLQGSLTLSGSWDETDETKSAAVVLNPQNKDSPIFRGTLKDAPITAWLGADGNTVQRVTGKVTDYAVDSAAGTVTLPFGDLSIGWDDTPQVNQPADGTVIDGAWLIGQVAAWQAGQLGATVTTDLDTSLNPITILPDPAQFSGSWDMITKTADAEGALVRFNGAGTLAFRNRRTLAFAAPVRTVTNEQAVKALLQQVGAYDGYKAVEVDWTQYEPDTARTVVFSPQLPWHIPAHSTRTFVRSFPDGALAKQAGGTGVKLADGTDPASLPVAYRAARDRNGVTEHAYGSLTVTVTQLSPTQIKVVVKNASGNDVWLVTPSNYTDNPAGTPALWVSGIAITQDDPTTVTSTHGAGQPVLTVDSSVLRQDHDAAESFADWLLIDMYYPRPEVTSLDIFPDFRLEPGDKITVTDSVSGVDVDALIFGVSFSAAGGDQPDWSMTLDVRPMWSPGSWVPGVAGMSTVGVSTWT